MRVAASLLVLPALLLAGAAGAAKPSPAGSFVTRSGARLVLDGRSFRFGGANIEWLGVAGYGPFDPAGPHVPSRYEVDDALVTAREMGATVVRSQTLGDTVGCAVCIEPSRGVFNAAALAHVDSVVRSARAHGIRLIVTLVGDDARDGATTCVYLRWRGITPPDNCSLVSTNPFFDDPAVTGDVEAHIRALLEHRSVYTHVALKDDPTILGWDLLNGGGSPPAWTRRIVRFVRSIDRRHLILSGPDNARLGGVGACVSFVYPHWKLPLAAVRPGIAECRAARKPFIAYEYGWDRTNYPTLGRLRAFLDALRADPEIAGDAFWALQAHADGHGWMPIPADTSDPAQAATIESGQWWALYYPGISTLVNTAADMAARAQAIRRHDYAMRGLRVPPHAIPPAPTITSTAGGRVYWRGSAGARDYSVQSAAAAGGPWTTLCRRCVTDADDGFADPRASPARAWYRVIPYNLDGRAGPASAPRRRSPGP